MGSQQMFGVETSRGEKRQVTWDGFLQTRESLYWIYKPHKRGILNLTIGLMSLY